MTTLEKIFSKCKEFKIFPCLDESYSYTDTKISFPKKYIGCIYSVSNIDEILESISEEGSSMINYKIKSDKYTEKIINIFCTILIECGFDPYTEFKYDKKDFIIDNTVSIVISYKDLFGDKKYEDFEYDDDDDNDDDDDDNDDDDDDNDDDDEILSKTEDDDDEILSKTEEVDEIDKKEHDGVEDDVDKKEHDEESVGKKEHDEESVHDEEDVNRKEHDVDEVVGKEHKEKDTEEEYTYEKLKKKYRQELLDLARDLGITSWKNKNIQKHLKSDIIECIMNQKK
jgi:hypothetical protein